jgi:multicomponent Na+:H+ antiporter subunit C
MALTAIVISFGVTAFLLALAYRSWLLTADDEVEDDVTDRLISAGGFEDEEVVDARATPLDDEDDLGAGPDLPRSHDDDHAGSGARRSDGRPR